eukprot:c564_g1_i1 orf=31-1320(-)
MECNSDHFPAGLRVLVVDDDPICLLIVERLLRSCLYQVTTCGEAVIALSMLRENRSRFDVVLSDVHMPHMDGFRLLELVRLEMDVPVIMMSANGETSNVMKGISQGACDYLLKPVRLEELRNIWQHVVRKQNPTVKEPEQAPDPKDHRRARTTQTEAEIAIDFTDNGNVPCSSQRKRKVYVDEDSANEEEDNLATTKRQRVVWSVDLHQKFVAAINHLGLEQAVPKRILDLMNVPGLTRENVASHLQKYRLYLKKMSGSINQKLGMPTCIGPSGSFMNSLAFLNGYSPSQALDHFSQQAVIPLQPGIGGGYRADSDIGTKQGVANPPIDYQEYCVNQYFDPRLQGHLRVTGSAIDSQIGPALSSGQLRIVPQQSSDFFVQQSLRVPKFSGTLWNERQSVNELQSLISDHLFIHQLETAADMRSGQYNSS